MTKATLAWNYAKLLTELGSNRAVMDLIRARRLEPPPLKTVAGWRQRNSIPGKWAPLVIQIGIERGLIKDIEALRRTPRQKFRKSLEDAALARRSNIKPEWAEL